MPPKHKSIQLVANSVPLKLYDTDLGGSTVATKDVTLNLSGTDLIVK